MSIVGDWINQCDIVFWFGGLVTGSSERLFLTGVNIFRMLRRQVCCTFVGCQQKVLAGVTYCGS
jgi:hypothetical protein